MVYEKDEKLVVLRERRKVAKKDVQKEECLD